MNWTIKMKLLVLAALSTFFVVGVGGIGYQGIGKVDHAMDSIVTTSEMVKNLMEADMMHDAVRSDVYAAFVFAEQNDAEKEKAALETLQENSETFRARIVAMEAIAKEEGNEEILATISRLKVVLEDYIREAREVSLLAISHNPQAHKRLEEDFEGYFETLLVLMEKFSEEVHGDVARAQSLGDTAVVSSKSRILGMSLLALLLVVAISFWVVRSVSSGVSDLVRIVDRVTQGDLRTSQKSSRRDEIGLILNQFGEMTRTLSQLVSGIKHNAAAVSSKAAVFSVASDQIKASTQGTVEKVSSVSASSEEASRNIEAVVASTEEMSSTISDISQNIQEATRITAEAVTMVESTNATISKLGDSSAEIGNVIKVITAIAQQTNLLALNATIEAARAGEAGKGFAVVANEVKDLAKATANATEEINQKITAIQADSGNAVTAIGEIERVIHKINEISVNIAGAIEEQSATTGEISRAVSEAASGASEIASDIAQVAKASEDVSKGTESINAGSRDLARLGEALVRMVAFFKTGDSPRPLAAQKAPEKAAPQARIGALRPSV